ncbi:hypothetical protein QBC44DRAFT_405335 [Cladorrhinum sp. PSN332]|nr:hypothetical protein QBC44DRAFT_405335 [Cladorrhinum sp. PSN332]
MSTAAPAAEAEALARRPRRPRSPPPAPAVARLPPELRALLREAILGEASWPSGYKAGVADLSRLARANRACHAVFQPLLYEHVAVNSFGDIPNPRRSRVDFGNELARGSNGYLLLRTIATNPKLAELIQELTFLLPLVDPNITLATLSDKAGLWCQSLLRGMNVHTGREAHIIPGSSFDWGFSTRSMMLLLLFCHKVYNAKIIHRLREDWLAGEVVVVPPSHALQRLHLKGARLNEFSNLLRPLTNLQSLDLSYPKIGYPHENLNFANLTRIRITAGRLDVLCLAAIVRITTTLTHFEYYAWHAEITADEVLDCLEPCARNIQVLGVSGLCGGVPEWSPWANVWDLLDDITDAGSDPTDDSAETDLEDEVDDITEASICERFPNLRALAIHYCHFNANFDLDRSVALNLVQGLPKLRTLVLIAFDIPSVDDSSDPTWGLPEDANNNNNTNNTTQANDDDDDARDYKGLINKRPVGAITEDLKRFASVAPEDYHFIDKFHAIKKIVVLAGRSFEVEDPVDQNHIIDFVIELGSCLHEDVVRLEARTGIEIKVMAEFNQGAPPAGWEKCTRPFDTPTYVGGQSLK